jgi:hypothetical protein
MLYSTKDNPRQQPCILVGGSAYALSTRCPDKKGEVLNKKNKQNHVHIDITTSRFTSLHNSTLPFPAYNVPKVLLSADTASIHIYSSLSSAKASPSYTLLVMDTYSGASR